MAVCKCRTQAHTHKCTPRHTHTPTPPPALRPAPSRTPQVSKNYSFDNRPHSFQVYAPSRTVAVYAPAEFCDKDADKKPHGIPGLAVKGLGPYYER